MLLWTGLPRLFPREQGLLSALLLETARLWTGAQTAGPDGLCSELSFAAPRPVTRSSGPQVPSFSQGGKSRQEGALSSGALVTRSALDFRFVF